MMTEIWWKVFLASIIIVIVSKLFGVSAHFLTIFSISFIGCAVGLILLTVISSTVWEKWQTRRKKNGESKEPPE